MNIKGKLMKHAPEILLGFGILFVIGGTVKACHDTKEATEIIDDTKKTIDTMHECRETHTEEEYPAEIYKKEITATYIHATGKVVKTYLPAFAIMTTGIGMILASHKMLSARNVALSAAYTAVQEGYSEYRKRVINKFGEEVDKQIRYNVTEEKETVETVDETTGKTKKTKVTRNVVEDTAASPYSKFFEESNIYWEKDPELNLMFLKSREQQANERLKRNRILFLNEVYDLLGLPRTKAGQIIGWVYKTGNDYVDFGIFNDCNKRAVNGLEPVFLLDFNCKDNVFGQL